jgi:outer membrane protein TolC
MLSIVAMLCVDGTMHPPSYAQPAPSPENMKATDPKAANAEAANLEDRELELTLANAIQLALQHNLDIEQERFGPKIARTDVEAARAEFDPVVGADASISQTKVLPTTEAGVVDPNTGLIADVQVVEPFSKNGELTPFLRQRIITGGSYELRFVNTRENFSPTTSGVTRTLADPRYESSMELAFTQPLLRGFGIAVNKAPIRRAEKSEAIAHQRVLQAILDVVFQVQERYWDMVFRLQDLEAQRESQKLAEDFLAENKIRVELGTLAPIELVQAETQVKLREEDVIVAEAAVREAEDALKEVINIPDVLGSWNIHLNPSDRPMFEPISSLAVEEKLREALVQRPDIIESQLDVESREIARQEALNQRLPRLDLQAFGSLSSYGDDVGEGLSDLTEINGYEWLFGLQFEYPLGNRAAQSNLDRRKLELRQALVAQRRLQLAIVREVRQAIRGIETASKRVEVTRAATKLARTQLEAEQEKFRLGLSTSFRVLEFQRELTDARSSETQALSDYNVELGRLDLRTGKLRYVDYQASGG